MALGGGVKGWLAAGLGAITIGGAIFGFVLNAQKVVEIFTGHRAAVKQRDEAVKQQEEAVRQQRARDDEAARQQHARDDEVARLLAVARAQRADNDFAAAMKTLDDVTVLAPANEDARVAREDIAMAWLRQARVAASANFTTVSTPLARVLDEGVPRATGSRQADLIAHRGWAEFLRERDEPEHHDPSAFYARALAVDGANPFAHAMLGHWMLWDHQDRAAALAHFDAAVASGRERPWVRYLEIAALKSNSFTDNAAEIVRVANAVRREGGTIDAAIRRDIHSLYYSVGRDKDDPLLAALPPEEHVTFYRWLFADDLADPKREPSYVLNLVALEEHAGHRDVARAELTALRARIADGEPQLKRQIDTELKRLGKA